MTGTDLPRSNRVLGLGSEELSQLARLMDELDRVGESDDNNVEGTVVATFGVEHRALIRVSSTEVAMVVDFL